MVMSFLVLLSSWLGMKVRASYLCCLLASVAGITIDFESPLSVLRVLSSRTIPLPVVGREAFSSELPGVDIFFLWLLPPSSFSDVAVAFLEFFFFCFLPPRLARISAMNFWCERRRRSSSRTSTDVGFAAGPVGVAGSDVASSGWSFRVAARWSSMRFRSFVFSSRRTSKDCSSVVVRHFFRMRLFFACFRFLSLRTSNSPGLKFLPIASS
mmetsp:Transcript_23136/g.54702  ORF Transcript_23136/g.54702 Transcript_23136/m.54702 type:complete len:211 (+) Transcript_23136:259-891(+)